MKEVKGLDYQDEDAISKILEINTKIGSKYDFLENLRKNVLEIIQRSNGLEFRQMSKLMENDILRISKNKGIVGVDGSINSIGSSYPNYICIMQSLAKLTNSSEKVFLSEVYTPLLGEDSESWDDKKTQEADNLYKASRMAQLELQAASMAVEKFDTSIIMLDGSLIRYKIYCGEEWNEFVKTAISKKVLVVGVIEEIKTKDLSGLIEDFPQDKGIIYDREILFGVLDVGQMIKIKDAKENRGLRKCFLRTSSDPHVIGMDILDEQSEYIDQMADLVYTLTPEDGRGIPLWLDIVDSEVKVSNKHIEALIDSYIDPKFKKMLFSAKRDNRTL